MAYRSEDRSDRWKAIAAVLLVHVLLGTVILTGLNVEIVRSAVERLETFDIAIPETPPPPPPPPPPSRREQEQQGAPAAPKASPVVAPVPEVRLPIQNPVVAAPEAGTGASASAGQGGVGSGTGAGGTGTGGGAGSGAGFAPARLINKIPNSDYRRIAGNRMPRGSAVITFRVETNGRPSGCRVVRSSGDLTVDAAICPIAVQRLHFRPARDALGRPVAQQITYVPTWRR